MSIKCRAYDTFNNISYRKETLNCFCLRCITCCSSLNNKLEQDVHARLDTFLCLFEVFFSIKLFRRIYMLLVHVLKLSGNVRIYCGQYSYTPIINLSFDFRMDIYVCLSVFMFPKWLSIFMVPFSFKIKLGNLEGKDLIYLIICRN